MPLNTFLGREMRSITRQRRDRHLLLRGRSRSVLEIAERCPLPWAESIVAMVGGRERSFSIEYGYREVRLPGHEGVPYRVVVRGFGKRPPMMLTSLPTRRNRRVVWSGGVAA